MRSLVMDGVRSRQPLDLRPAFKLDRPAAKPAQLTSIAPTFQPASLDGIRPPIAKASDPVVELGATEEQLRQNWVDSAVSARYRWAGAAAVGLILPLMALGAIRINDLRLSANQNAATRNAATSTVTTDAAPPLASVQAVTAVPQNDPLMQQLLHDFTNTQTTPFGIVVKDLKTGIVTSSSPDQVFTSASLYKLFVAQAIYKRVDTGQVRLGDATSAGRNVQDCLRAMINVSDNACGRALGSIVGWGRQDPDLKNLGFKNTSLTDPQRTSAADVAVLLERLYQGTLLSPTSTQQFVEFLKDQKVNNRLPVGLPAGTSIAHKTGDLNGFIHDAGIVYGPKTDYLIVMTSGPWPNTTNAPAVFADLSGKVFAHLNK